MSAARRLQRGRSNIVGFGVGLLVLAALYFIAPLLVGESGPVAPPEAPALLETVESGPYSPYRLTWNARSGDHPAPPARLLFRATDLYPQWRLGDYNRPARSIQSPDYVSFHVHVPGADSFPVELFGSICQASEERFSRCRNARARAIIFGGTWSSKTIGILRGTEPPPNHDYLPYAERPRLSRTEFWTRHDDASGRDRIVGWACTDDMKKSGSSLPVLDPLFAPQPDTRLACFEPANWWQRHAPERSGLRKHPAYVECPAKGNCEAHLLHQDRLVQIEFESDRYNADPWTRAMLFVATWETLERARSEAITPSPPTSELAEGDIQWQVCEALIAEANRWRDTRQPMSREIEEAWDQRKAPCLKAVGIAVRISETHPVEAVPLLGKLADALITIDASDSVIGPLVLARLSALERSGHKDTQALFDASAGALPWLRSNAGNDDGIALARLQEAWRLAALPSITASVPTLRDLATTLGWQLGQKSPDKLAQIGVYSQWTSLLERQGASPGDQLQALRDLGYAYWNVSDFDALRDNADRMRDAYLKRPTPPGIAPEKMEDPIPHCGIFAVLSYRNYAFNRSAFAEVESSAAAVADRLTLEYGPDSRFSKAARFHLREIQTRRPASSGTPIGGGFLPY